MSQRLEIQNKLIAKFGNPLNAKERTKFEQNYKRTLKFPAVVTDRFPKVDVNTGEGEAMVTTQECIIGYQAQVHASLVSILFISLERLSKTECINELKGKILCYEPALMPGSDTTVCYTSWGLAFRFDQEESLSLEASNFFIAVGFKPGIDKDGKEYFIADIEKLLK